MTEFEKNIEAGLKSMQESINELAGYDIPDKVKKDFQTRLDDMRERYEATIDENNEDTDTQRQDELRQIESDLSDTQNSLSSQMGNSGEVTPRTSM